MLPNLSALRQQPTGQKQKVCEWLDACAKKGKDPDRDPITNLDWRQEVRDAEEDDQPVAKLGWILKVIDPVTKQVVEEDQYLYDIEQLAQHLVNGGVSPMTRAEPDDADRNDLIALANEMRGNRVPPLPPLQPQRDEEPPLPPLPVLSRAAARAHGRNVPEAEANAALRDAEAEASARFREAREILWARRAEERRQRAAAADAAMMGGQAPGAIPMPGHRPGDREAREARLQELEQQLERLGREAQEREPRGGQWLHRG